MANKKVYRWTDSEDRFLRENIGRIPYRDLCQRIGRSEQAVRLYVLRQRIDVPGPKVKNNLLRKLLQIRFRNLEDFTPSRAFYKSVGIPSHRYYDIFFGRCQIKGDEYARIADYFNISIQECFEARQLSLFDDL